MTSASARQFVEISSTGDLVIEAKTFEARIDSYKLTSESPALREEYAAVVSKADLKGDILRVQLPDCIPDGALVCVLMLLYPSTFGQVTLSSQRDWSLALMLAVRWDLTSIRTLAMSTLERFLFRPVERAVVGAALGVQEWVNNGMEELMREVAPLGLDGADVDAALEKKKTAFLADLTT